MKQKYFVDLTSCVGDIDLFIHVVFRVSWLFLSEKRSFKGEKPSSKYAWNAKGKTTTALNLTAKRIEIPLRYSVLKDTL